MLYLVVGGIDDFGDFAVDDEFWTFEGCHLNYKWVCITIRFYIIYIVEFQIDMGNQMDNCQQCHIKPTESTATKSQTSHIVLANKRQESAASSEQIKVANNKTV